MRRRGLTEEEGSEARLSLALRMGILWQEGWCRFMVVWLLPFIVKLCINPLQIWYNNKLQWNSGGVGFPNHVNTCIALFSSELLDAFLKNIFTKVTDNHKASIKPDAVGVKEGFTGDDWCLWRDQQGKFSKPSPKIAKLYCSGINVSFSGATFTEYDILDTTSGHGMTISIFNLKKLFFLIEMENTASFIELNRKYNMSCLKLKLNRTCLTNLTYTWYFILFDAN